MTPRFLVRAQVRPLAEMKMIRRGASLGAVIGSVWGWTLFLTLEFFSLFKEY